MWKNGIYNFLAISIILAIFASSVAVFSAADLAEGICEKGLDEGGSAFPEDEAGIAAYIFTNQTISIEKIKTIFSSVVEVGDNYIIGITQIPDNRCRSDIRSESLEYCYPYGASSTRTYTNQKHFHPSRRRKSV